MGAYLLVFRSAVLDPELRQLVTGLSLQPRRGGTHRLELCCGELQLSARCVASGLWCGWPAAQLNPSVLPSFQDEPRRAGCYRPIMKELSLVPAGKE